MSISTALVVLGALHWTALDRARVHTEHLKRSGEAQVVLFGLSKAVSGLEHAVNNLMFLRGVEQREPVSAAGEDLKAAIRGAGAVIRPGQAATLQAMAPLARDLSKLITEDRSLEAAVLLRAFTKAAEDAKEVLSTQLAAEYDELVGAQVASDTDGVQSWLFIVGALVCLLSVLGSWMLFGALRPVKRIIEVVLGFGDDMDARVGLERADELGAIGQAIDDAGSKLQRMMLALQQVQDELIESRNVAERASVAKSEFLANMSHELRTPLNAILGFSNRLIRKVEDRLSPREWDALLTIRRNGRGLLELVNDVLDLSKISAGQLELALAEVDVTQIIEQAVTDLEALATQKGLRVEVELAGPTPVLADRVRLRQIIVNLLSNAIKYTEAGQVTLGTSVGPDGVSVWVRDTGVGMSPDQVELVFDKFSQFDATRFRIGAGTGLGLALVQQLVRLHGGRVAVVSEKGIGSTFTVFLPA